MAAVPQISVVIPVRDRRTPLDACLASLAAQRDPPRFEVVIVDDGSRVPLERRALLGRGALAVTVLRQVPLGIAAARNLGVRACRGELVLFLDSDCTADAGALRELARCAEAHPRTALFQLALRGDRATAAGRIEDARLRAIQRCTRRCGGAIAYANTSALAVRRAALPADRDPFDPAYVRGEDSVLLGELERRAGLPRWVRRAVVTHAPALRVSAYVLRHLRVGYRGQAARKRLAREGLTLLGARGRARMLRVLAQRRSREGRERIGTLAGIAACYGLELVGRACHELVGLETGRVPLLAAAVDPVREQELVARMLSCASAGRALSVTYANAWTLVQASRDARFAARLRRFDVVYPDGMGAVLALWVTRSRRAHKVTADDFLPRLCRGAAQRGVRIALVGGADEVAARAAAAMRAAAPGARIVLARGGYVAAADTRAVLDRLRRARPALVLLGMGQPLQEEWAERVREALPNAVVHCVGGLFDMLAGETARPPRWVRRCALEWLHRLIERPGALWRRYLLGLPLLSWICARDVATRALQRGRAIATPRPGSSVERAGAERRELSVGP